MTQTDELLDRIERQVDIDADAERVWGLVSCPGWWINDGDVDPDAEVRTEGGLHLVSHPEYGEFRLQTLEQDPPRYVSFRWIDDPETQAGTLVEFWIEDRPGGVTLKVSESGFATLDKERSAILRHVEQNTAGWEHELEAARRFVTGDRG